MVKVDARGKEKYYFIQYARQRIRQNKNFLLIISGPTGSGKSWSAISVGEMLDKEFNVNRIIFKGSELLKLINSGELKKGSVVIWDEAGIDLSNRNWQTATNKLLNFLLQTFRHKNIILIFTTPYADFMDKLTRKLFHSEIRTVSIDYDNKTTKVKPQLIQYNARMGKFYYKYLRVIGIGGGVSPLTEWNIPAPSKEIIEAYERKKQEFTENLNKEIEQELGLLEHKQIRRTARPLTDLQREYVDLLKDGYTVDKISEKMGVTNRTIHRYMELIKNKGIEIKPIKEAGSSRVVRYNVIEV